MCFFKLLLTILSLKVASSLIQTLTLASFLVPISTLPPSQSIFYTAVRELLKTKQNKTKQNKTKQNKTKNWMANPVMPLLETLQCLSIAVSIKIIIVNRNA